MPYTKTVWTDEVLSEDARYDIKDNDGNPINETVQIELVTDVVTAGTSITAERMNNIEDGLEAVHDTVDNTIVPQIDGLFRQFINGLRLTWNSGTSISVGVGACYAENGDLIDVASTLTAGSLSLSASTWYHVYVYLSGGSPAMEVVTTAPVLWRGTAYSKTGDTSRRYVGSVLTDGSSNVMNFVHNPLQNQILYRKFQSTASPCLVLNGGTATTATAVGCSSIVPATSRTALIHIVNTADQVLRTGDDNSVSSAQVTYALSAGNTAAQRFAVPHILDSSLQLWYAFNAAVGSGGATMYVLGYWFER